MSMQISQLIKRERSANHIPQFAHKSLQIASVGRKSVLNLAGGKMKVDIWEGSPFYMLALLGLLL